MEQDVEKRESTNNINNTNNFITLSLVHDHVRNNLGYYAEV